MTSTQSLLHAAASDVTIERVRALVREVGPESPTLEYKEQVADSIPKGVAALANTYGGLLLVGVTDDRVVKGVHEKAIESVAERCAAKIEPPWVPEIIPVPLQEGSDRYVLVLRVIPGHHPSPLLVNGVAYVRHQNTTHPADWQRLRDLFAEGVTFQQDEAWNLRAPSMPTGPAGTSDSSVDFVTRSGFNIAVSRDAKWRPLAESTVTALIHALSSSPLTTALVDPAFGYASPASVNQFRRQGHNTSRTVRLVWYSAPQGWPTNKPAPVEVCVLLEVPGAYGHLGTHLRVQIDVIVRRSVFADTADQPPAAAQQSSAAEPQRVSAQQLGQLIDGMLATLTCADVVAPLAKHAGIPAEAIPQPRVLHMVTGRPFTEVLDTTALQLIQGAGPSHGAHLLADPALDLADGADRQQQVLTWLEQIALDAGLIGMEQVLERLSAPSHCATPPNPESRSKCALLDCDSDSML